MDDMFAEAIHLQGNRVFYLPRKYQKYDPILGEDVLSKFEVALPVDMLVESYQGYEGDREVMTKFGLQIKDQVRATIARIHFEYAVGRYAKSLIPGRPNEGDLIYIPEFTQLFEIKFIENQEPYFYTLGRLPAYNLLLEAFQYASEEINTGIESIDKIADKFTHDRLAFEWLLEDSSGVFLMENGSRFLLETPYPVADSEVEAISISAEETAYEKEARENNVLNFSEDNPFSEYF